MPKNSRSSFISTEGREEVDGIVAEQGRAEVGCDFCGRQYHFDAIDVGGLFAPAGQRPPVLAARSPQPGMRLRPAAAQRRPASRIAAVSSPAAS